MFRKTLLRKLSPCHCKYPSDRSQQSVFGILVDYKLRLGGFCSRLKLKRDRDHAGYNNRTEPFPSTVSWVQSGHYIFKSLGRSSERLFDLSNSSRMSWSLL